MRRWILAGGSAVGMVALLGACQSPNPGPMQRAGAALDRAGEKTGQAVGNATEAVGRKISQWGQELNAKTSGGTAPSN